MTDYRIVAENGVFLFKAAEIDNDPLGIVSRDAIFQGTDTGDFIKARIDAIPPEKFEKTPAERVDLPEEGFVCSVNNRTGSIDVEEFTLASPQPIRADDLGNFCRYVTRYARDAGADRDYLLAVAYCRSKNLTDLGGTETNKRIGPFQFTLEEWNAAITTGPAKGESFNADDIFWWTQQPLVAALLAADCTKKLQDPGELGRIPTMRELYFAQLFGPGAAQILKRSATDLCKDAVQGTPVAGSYAADLAAGNKSIGEVLAGLEECLTAGYLEALTVIEQQSPEIRFFRPQTEAAASDGSFEDKCRKFMPLLMQEFDLTLEQAAGVFGNLGTESGGFRYHHEIGQPEGKGGYGWAQWTATRRDDFFKWCKDQNPALSPESDEASYGFLCVELRGSEANAITEVKKTTTVEEAVAAFERAFERAGKPNLTDRYNWARKAFTAMVSEPPPLIEAGRSMNIEAVCAKHWDADKGDCAAFARDVARELGTPFAGTPNANAIADLLAGGDGRWEVLPDGRAAATASADRLVIGGLRGDQQAERSEHGHVVIVVPGPLNRDKYPTAWWGSLGGKPDKHQTINFAWREEDRDKVVYAAHVVTG